MGREAQEALEVQEALVAREQLEIQVTEYHSAVGHRYITLSIVERLACNIKFLLSSTSVYICILQLRDL